MGAFRIWVPEVPEVQSSLRVCVCKQHSPKTQQAQAHSQAQLPLHNQPTLCLVWSPVQPPFLLSIS